MDPRNLFFVESPEEITYAQSHLKAKYTNFLYVSFSSQAKQYLLDNKLDHINAYEFADLKTLEMLTSEHYVELKDICDQLDSKLQQDFSLLKEFDIQPFFFNYIYLKILLDTLKQRLFFVESLCQQFCGSIYIIQCDEVIEDLYMSPQFRLTPLIVSLIKDQYGGRIQFLPDLLKISSRVQKSSDSNFRELEKKIYRVHFFKRICSFLSRKALSLKNCPHLKQGNKNFLSIGSFIPLKLLRNQRLKRITLDFNKMPEFSQGFQNLNDYAEEFFRIKAYQELVKYIHPNAHQIINRWMERNIINKIPEYISKANYVLTIMKQKTPSFLEGHSFFSPDQKLVATLFRKQKTPILGTQHGSLGMTEEKLFYFGDFSYVTDYFVWGEGVKKYIHHYPIAIKRPFSIHVSGTDHYLKKNIFEKDKVLKILGFSKDKPTFVFCGSGFNHNIFYNYFFHMSEQSEYEKQRKIIDFFAKNSDLQLLYKGMQGPYCDELQIEEYIFKLKSTNVKYIRNISMKEIIPICDGYIIDRPSTSTLEALHEGKYVYTYNSSLKFPNNSDDLYYKAIQHFLTPEDLVKKLALDVRQNFENIPKDSGYFEAYGNYKNGLNQEKILENCLKMQLKTL